MPERAATYGTWAMDLRKFTVPDWLMIGGALGFLIFGTFVDWITASGAGVSASGANAFDFFLTGTVPWILIIGSGVVAFLLAEGIIRESNVSWPLVLLGATALGALLVLLRLLFPTMGEDTGPLEEAGVEFGRALGLWVSALAAIVATVGAAMNFRAHGGTMSNLTDVDAMRASFRRDGGSRPSA